MGRREIAGDDLGKPDGGAAADGDQAVGAGRARGGEPRFRHRLGHVDHGLRVQAGGARAEQIHDAGAEAGAAARRGDDQRAVDAEAARLLADAGERAGREHDALGCDIMGEGERHAALIRIPVSMIVR